ncbi:MAG: mechanosensitive ion channel domain-containing protein [Chloroflexota bacterium]
MNYIFDFVRDVVIWTSVAVIAYLVLFQWLRIFVNRTRFEADNIVLRIIRLPLIAAIVAYGFVSAFRELPLTEPVHDAVTNIYVVILIAAAVYLLWRVLKEVVLRWLVKRAGETETRVDDLVVPLLGTFGPLIFFLVGLVTILQYLGVNVAVLATSIGILGLVIGLAFQDSLANLFSGIYLMIDPAFIENDLIRVDSDKVYSVEKVGLRMTRLYDMDSHASVFIPNSVLTKSQIANITKPTIDMKVQMRVTMPCNVDLDNTSDLLHKIATTHRHTLDANDVQLNIIRERIEAIAPPTGERGAMLSATMTSLEGWLRSDAGNDADYANLLAVRKDMNDWLGEAQRAIRQLPRGKVSGAEIDRLHDAVNQGNSNVSMLEIDESRMGRIFKAYATIKKKLSADETQRLEMALNRVDELNRKENELEASIDEAEHARENELDRLMTTLVWTGDWVAEELLQQGKGKEAARVSLWVRNIAVVYCFHEVEESLNGLDKELDNLIDWLNELEAEGLTKGERARIRMLFGGWGGLGQMEKRRIGELRRRIMRWVQWKEKEGLDAHEYRKLEASWDSKLRVLSRKIPDTGTSDEETLDTRLILTRRWLHSVNFIEQLDLWKLPRIDLMAFDEDKLDYMLTFYIDDIKLEHFGRAATVKSDILADLYETCKREGLPSPTVHDA